MWFLRNSSSLLWPWGFRTNRLVNYSWRKWSLTDRLQNLSVFVSILTSGLMRYFRCSSIIASNAAVVGANTVIGPGWSSKDARGVFCREHKLSNLINLQLRNLRTRSSFTSMCYWDKCSCTMFEVGFRQRSVLTANIYTFLPSARTSGTSNPAGPQVSVIFPI